MTKLNLNMKNILTIFLAILSLNSYGMEIYVNKEIDREYNIFITNFFKHKDYYVFNWFNKAENKILTPNYVLDPNNYFIQVVDNNDIISDNNKSSECYAKSDSIGYWAEKSFYSEEELTLVKRLFEMDATLSYQESKLARNLSQGIKIHISALPHTAKQIAETVLPFIYKQKVAHKVIFHIPMMRYLYYSKTHKNTQTGKFITIYPRNLSEAQELLENLNLLLQSKNFAKTDFAPVIGDIEIGTTGGLFARYGSYSGTYIFQMDENGDLISNNNKCAMIKDNRYFPWPDYMNSKVLFPNSPFGKLTIAWKYSHRQREQIITWENRPEQWEKLFVKEPTKTANTIDNKNKSLSLLERLKSTKTKRDKKIIIIESNEK